MGLWSIDFEKKQVENRLHVSIEENNRYINFNFFFFYINIYSSAKSNILCIPESFYTKILQQPFDYKITFVNSQHKNSNSKGDFMLKNWFETSVLKISDSDLA